MSLGRAPGRVGPGGSSAVGGGNRHICNFHGCQAQFSVPLRPRGLRILSGWLLQTRHVLGVEVRGSLLKWGSDQHEESALAGPRAALHLGRFSPYACGLVGIGNAWSRNLPGERSFIIEETGLQWSVLGGVDIRVAHHLRLRVGELAYSKIYLSNRTLSPLNASAGFVYRIN